METLTVNLSGESADRSYPIQIGHGLIQDAALFDAVLGDAPVVLVTNETIAPLYLEQVSEALGAERQVTTVVLPDGEEQKHLMSANQIWSAALDDRQERRTVFLALGGGVVGDLTGFAAACFLRGARFVQLPTTLLAQVDSSVGGKTGFTHPHGKNLIGAFHQPDAVLIDLDTLATLPEREYAAGISEVIKYGCIRDPEFFAWLVSHQQALKDRNADVLAAAIQRSCRIKAEVVAQDEREGGLRAILNFGHTFGHAIEQVMGYGSWLHGEAVACGMVMASRISAARGAISASQVDQLIEFLTGFGLPTRPPESMTVSVFLEAMAGDKKVDRGRIRYVLLARLGEACLADDVTAAEIAVALAAPAL